MSQIPPPVPQVQVVYPTQPIAQKANGLAIASLVCGVVGCIPFLTSLIALVLGWVGLRKARNPDVGGKGLALAGMILGLIGLAGWTLFAGVLIGAYISTKPARGVAHQFALDLSNGNVSAAVAASAGISAEQLTDVADKMKPWGTLTDTSFTGFNTRYNNGISTCELTGTATFTTGGSKSYTITLVKRGAAYQVQEFNFN